MVFKITKTLIAFALFGFIATRIGEARTHFYSFYSDDQTKYLEPIEKYRQVTGEGGCVAINGNVRAGIVTHHMLAVDLMAEFFLCLSKHAMPDRVILIGPDHYAQSLAGISVSSLPWKTPFGELSTDAGTVSTIQKTADLEDDREVFSGEHSVGVLVPFIKYYFPRSKVVPLIIQRNIEPEKLIRLKAFLVRSLNDPKTIVLLSMDFSHNLTSPEADKHDEASKQVIEKLQYGSTDALDIDCHPGLKVLLAALTEQRDIRVKFLNHSNSAKLSGDLSQKNATSYYTILFWTSSKQMVP